MVFNDEGNEHPNVRAIEFLEDAECIIGHNIIGFDIPVIQKLYPWFTPRGTIIDTLLLSRLYHADALKYDSKFAPPIMPTNLRGRHSLESWGYRLGNYKGGFGKTTDWKEWSVDMQDYMLQDIEVTKKLWQHFVPYLNGSSLSTK